MTSLRLAGGTAAGRHHRSSSLCICSIPTWSRSCGAAAHTAPWWSGSPEQDEAKAAELEAWLDRLLLSYGVVPMDAPAFREWARLMHRRSETMAEDAMIAATASVHRLRVVTRNVRDFEHLGVEVFNPFEET